DGEQTTVALHHHPARVALRFRDQRNPPCAPALDELPDVFGTRASFPPTAAGQNQPHSPIPLGSQLAGPRQPPPPLVRQSRFSLRVQAVEKLSMGLRPA